MNTSQRTILVAMVFALIASMVLGHETDAKQKHRHHDNRDHRASISREAAKDRGSLVNADAKRKRKGHRSRANVVQVDPNAQVPPASATLLAGPIGRTASDPSLRDLGNLSQTINPGVLDPEPDPCDEVEPVLNGFLPQTKTLTESDSFKAKLTVGQGVSVITCDLANHYFEVRFNNANIKTYVRASAGGVSIGGWNQTASLSGSIRVSFTVNFSPPSTIVLTNLKVLGVNFENTPNWLDNSLIKDALNAMFPDSIAIS
jgi:hypothetical protein